MHLFSRKRTASVPQVRPALLAGAADIVSEGAAGTRRREARPHWPSTRYSYPPRLPLPVHLPARTVQDLEHNQRQRWEGGGGSLSSHAACRLWYEKAAHNAFPSSGKPVLTARWLAFLALAILPPPPPRAPRTTSPTLHPRFTLG